MKKILLLMMLLCSMSTWAQDVIVKKDGSTVVCRVIEATSTEVTYKKWSDLQGSSYIIDKSLVSAINYESGRKETLNEAESLYKPNNQNDGMQALNDKTLWNMDFEANRLHNKVKKLRIAGCIVGGVSMIIGGSLIINGELFLDSPTPTSWDYVIPGAVLFFGGAAVTTGCLITAHKIEKRLQSQYIVNSAPLYHQEFRLKNGTSLSAGIDVLGDNTNRNMAMGIGFNYNF